jgi:hypothetical protein
MIDTGTTGIMMYWEDQHKFIDILCKFIAVTFNDTLITGKPIECVHQGLGFITITHCDKDCFKKMPTLDL